MRYAIAKKIQARVGDRVTEEEALKIADDAIETVRVFNRSIAVTAIDAVKEAVHANGDKSG